ncbi:MAG: hypothetical protein AAF528_09755 [Cyanobacteria bacterium P01_C01_bin.121]
MTRRWLRPWNFVEERDQQYEQWPTETGEKLQVGISELDRGEGLDGEAVIERLSRQTATGP